MSKSENKSEVQVARKSPRLNQAGDPLAIPDLKVNSNLQNLKQKFKHQRKNEVYIEDVYERAQIAKDMVRGSTGLVYDVRMINHLCLWDPSHQESPERFSKTLERCVELGLVQRCAAVTVREATEAELLKVHSQAHIDRLKATDGCHNADQMERLASNFDAIYIHPDTYKLALLSAGCVVQLVHEVVSGAVQNGMAIVRPPGHHAMQSEFCGYCYFNNVAVAAHHALDTLGLQRILIVDWDVHHGQATQQMFYDDPRVVYFSIHRYEHGEFWPNLRESEFDWVGSGPGAGYNFNVPLNQTGLGDADYLAVFHQLLLPMATEFQPELIIVSAGYDAAVGCPEGEMAVTPACYAHLLSSLAGLASGKIAVVLEGGYCVRSLAEGAALTLRALLADPCPNLPLQPAPSSSIQESILNCVYSHRAWWKCFQWQGSYPQWERDPGNEAQHWPEVRFLFRGPRLQSFPTRHTCPVQTDHTKSQINRTLDRLIAETKLLKPEHDVCFVFDPLMMEHKNRNDPGHPEKPSRIQKIYERHLEYNLVERLFKLESRFATREDLQMVHEESYLVELERLCRSTSSERITDDTKHQLLCLERHNSVYIHPQSFMAGSLAAGSLLQVVDSVLSGQSKAGVAIVRPPGHHAESYQACGFCVFNNISIAAKYAIKNYGVKRILILDWDIHHGNGTQRIFLSDPQVLYISIHRYDHGTFFPASEEAAASVVGSGAGLGFNVNIPWNQKGMGDVEYVAAFLQIVLPIAYQFSPDLVLVSAGFDAAVGDPLGGCKVSPEAFALLTTWLAPLAMGRVIVCLEGGYNLTSISYAMTLCTKSLLGDPPPQVDLQTPLKPRAVADLKTVLAIQGKHWSALCFNKTFPKEDVLKPSDAEENTVENNEETLHKLSLSDNKNDDSENVELFNADIKSNCRLSSDSGIAELEAKFNTQMLISEASEPNLREWSGLETKVPAGGSDQKANNSSVEDIAKPGPSQGSSSSERITLQIKTTVDSILKELGVDEGFAVHPRHDCPHLAAVSPLLPTGIDVNIPCASCALEPCAAIENWICLTCYSVQCGRVVKEHMISHSLETSHPIVLGFLDLSVWCYQCDSYIESPILYEAKNAAYISKFGETMPNIYS